MQDYKFSKSKIDRYSAAIDVIAGSDLPEPQRSFAVESLRASQTQLLDLIEEEEQREDEGKKWTESELEFLQSFCTGKVAKTYHEEKSNLVQLQAYIKRSPKRIQRRAAEMGLAGAVDYWFAQSTGLAPRER